MDIHSRRIVVADSSENYRYRVVKEIQKDGDLIVVGETGDGSVLLELVAKHCPDLILMEMNLENLDGIEVLERLKEMEFLHRPKILVVSSFWRDTVTRLISELDVDYYMTKPCQMARMVQRIRQLTQTADEDGTPAVVLERRVSEILQSMGMPAHVLGYYYLRWAICATMQQPELLHGVTKILYPMVAKEFATTPTRVERSIRHAIDMLWLRGDMKFIAHYFGNTVSSSRGRPTNSEFIALISDRLRLEEQMQ